MALDIFPEFLERVELVYFPFLVDKTKIQECDIALIEGCVSEESQQEVLKEVRRKAKKVIALGTCAAHGGILNLSNENQGDPIAKYIEINGIISGCPPPSKLLGNSIIKLLENKDLEIPNKNLCFNCPLRGDLEYVENIEIKYLLPQKYPGTLPKRCFLRDHILCLGPITRAGCENQCIEYGIPCEGCMGPISQEFTASIINYLSILKLSTNLKNYRGIYFRFAKPKIGREKI